MSVAKNYARALFDSLPESDRSGKAYDQLSSDLDTVVTLVQGSKELQVALRSGITSGQEKAAIVAEICDQMKISKQMKNFLMLLARKGRFEALEEVRSSLNATKLLASGGIVGRVVSADTLDPAEVDSLADAFSTKLGKTIEFEVSVNPELLAGLQVTVNGVTYDGTLRTQLQGLKESFIQASKEVH